MRAYYSLYEEFPNWYKYTHEMFTYRFSHDETADCGMSSVFWSHYDKEIPIPALKALKDGVEDGSIRKDINIYAIYQILLNAFTGVTLYENISFGGRSGGHRAYDRFAHIKIYKKRTVSLLKNTKSFKIRNIQGLCNFWYRTQRDV